MGCGASAPKPPEASKGAPADVPKPAPASSAKEAASPGASKAHFAGDLAGAESPKAKGGYEAADAPKVPLQIPADAVAPLEIPAPAAPKPCLHYYPFAGRGELSRLIAAAGGLDMDEKIEKESTHLFGSPGSWPCLEHDSLKISQSFAIECYISRISPVFKDLTPIQRAEDAMFCKIKEDMIAGYRDIVSRMIADESQKASGAEDIATLSEKWLPLIESRLPLSGFINGLAFPTAADLAVLNVARAFMPFGAAFWLGGYDFKQKFPKLAAHANRVAAYPTVRDYLAGSTTMHCDPVGLREASFSIGDAVEVRCHDHSSAAWKSARVTSLEPLQVKVDGWSWSSTWDEVRKKG